MAGTKAGGVKAAATNKKIHGDDFYRKIGQKGGKNGKGPGYKGGFASSKELAKKAGAKGGKRSSRAGVKNGEGKDANKAVAKKPAKKRAFFVFRKAGK